MHSLVAGTFLLFIARTITFTFFLACALSFRAQVSVKGVCMCVTSFHFAFSSLMSHPSLLFFDGRRPHVFCRACSS